MFEERGDQLGCESVWIVDILNVEIDREVSLTRLFENVRHDARLSKTPWSHKINVVCRQELPDALDKVFTPEQLVGFGYASGEAPNGHVARLLVATLGRTSVNNNRFVAFIALP
jgi:hypothetical protein